MMMVVVDCSVLEVCSDPRDARYLDGLALLWRIADCHRVVLDHERFIEAEYRRRALGVPYLAEWFQRLAYGLRIDYVSGKLSKKEESVLSKEAFDPDDWTYVGVSRRTAAPIIHEDSDYEGAGPSTLGVSQSRIKPALSAVPDCGP